MTKKNPANHPEIAVFDAPIEPEEAPNAHARQAFMGHDFLRRNLLLLLPPAIKPVTRRVN
jgi:hypothetical protein